MEEGKAWGWVQVTGTALTPAKAMDNWQVWVERTAGAGEWLDAPALRATVRVEESDGDGVAEAESGEGAEGNALPVEFDLHRQIKELQAANARLSADNSRLTQSNDSLSQSLQGKKDGKEEEEEELVVDDDDDDEGAL
jgi:hypothetical protein